MQKEKIQLTNKSSQLREFPRVKIESFSDLVSKLQLSEVKLSVDDIKNLGECILLVNEVHPNSKFIVAQNVDEFRNALDILQQKTLFIVLKFDNHDYWTTACITSSTACLMNPFEDAPVDTLSQVLKKNRSITLHVNELRSNENTFDDFIALKHLEMMVRQSNDFNLTKVADKSDVINMKGELKKNLIMIIYSNFLTDLKSNEKYKQELKKFILQCHEFIKLSTLAKNYQKVLQQEAEKCMNGDSDAQHKIKKVRNELMNSELINKLKDMSKYEEQKNSYRMNIENEFPDEMNTFKSFSSFLFQTKYDQNLISTLENVCEEINIDIQVMEDFFVNQQLEKSEKAKTKESISLDTIELKSITTNDEIDENIKTVEELLEELVIEDADESNDKLVLQELISQFEQINEFSQKWKYKTIGDIREWSNIKRSQLKVDEICEAIAVLNHANSLVTGWKSLRKTQILAILTHFQAKPNHGVFYEIRTGEGKTVIISLLAVLKILMDSKSVDIITSNSVLAQEGLDNRKDFYGIFNISVAVNNTDKNYKRDERECYSADVVYGTMGNFQGDYLRHEFENLNTRGSRQLSCIILDEVDSILLDSGGHITKLATPFPGMDALKYIYIKIWQELLKVEEKFHETFAENMKIKYKNLKNLNDDERDLEMQLYQQNYFKNSYDQIIETIRAAKPTEIKLIPPHLRDFSNENCNRWIESAIYAKFSCYENIHYVIRKNEDDEDVVVPVDYLNTGVTLKNTTWSNGLHQFVQLKHNLNITTETLTSSFISNIGYVKLYGNNLFGLSGTLGSEAEYKLLSEVYNLNYILIPPYKHKQFNEYKSFVIEDDSWIDAIALLAIMETKKKRSVLIICKTILDVFDVKKTIEILKEIENLTQLKIKVYPDEQSSKIVSEKVGLSEIIIATNIAGRGADFRTTDELESYGGIHVCVAFIPTNQRVQDQAFGRTSRQGKKGSANIIAKASDIGEFENNDISNLEFKDIIEFRDDAEESRLNKIKINELPRIHFMDEIFTKFLNLFKRERGQTTYTKPYLKDIKEFWAFWLKKNDYSDHNNNKYKAEDEFGKFRDEINSMLSTKMYRNPYYCIKEVELLINDDKHKEAKLILEKIIEKTPESSEFLYSAHIKLFEIAIRSGNVMMDHLEKTLSKILVYGYFTDDKNHDYINDAKENLRKAKIGLEIEKNYIESLFEDKEFLEIFHKKIPYNNLKFENTQVSEKDEKQLVAKIEDISQENSNVLSKHLESRLTILSAHYTSIEEIHSQLETMRNAIMKSKISQYFETFKPESKDQQKIKDSMLKNELDELSMLGLDVVYSLQEVHDVHNTVLIAAQGQITAGLAALVGGFCFPMSLPIMVQIAGTLISEGICDIVIGLISQIETEFDWKAYAVEKAISYGISIVTMGVSALATSAKLLNKVLKILNKVSSFLKNCPKFVKVCQKIVKFLDKLMKLIQKNINIVKNVKKIKTIKQVVLKVVGETVRESVTAIISDKIISKILDEILNFLKPKLKNDCRLKVKEFISEENVLNTTMKNINDLLIEVLEESTPECILNIAKEISFGLLRSSKFWTLKVASLTIDSILTTVSLTDGISTYCNELNLKLSESNVDENINADNYSYEIKIEMISDHFCEYMYGKIKKILQKGANTFAVSPLMNKAASLFKSKNKSNALVNFSNNEDESIDKVSQAYKTLGLDTNASETDIDKQLRTLAMIHHPDKNQGDGTKMSEISEARETIKQFLNNNDSFSFPTRNNQRNDDSSTSQNNSSNNNNQQLTSEQNQSNAHAGNIKTICKEKELNIEINVLDANSNEVKNKKYGKKFKRNRTIELDFTPATKDKPGHFSSKDGFEIPSGKNKCLYDSVSASLKHKYNIDTSPAELRSLAEQSNFTNFKYGALKKFSNLLNNSVTQKIFLRCQNKILVGGQFSPEEQNLRINNNGTGQYPGGIKFDKAKLHNGIMEVYYNAINNNNYITGDLHTRRHEALNERTRNERRHRGPKPKTMRGRVDRSLDGSDNFTRVNLTDERDLEHKIKSGTMIGVMIATVKNQKIGEKIQHKFYTFSGDSAYMTNDHITDETKSGFRFVNFNYEYREDKHIFNLQTHEMTDKTYEKSCAAVKLSMALQDLMQKLGKNYVVVDRHMAEVYFKPEFSKKEQIKNSFEKYVWNSCEFCERTLPFTYGEKIGGSRRKQND